MLLSKKWASILAAGNFIMATLLTLIWHNLFWKFSSPVVLQDELLFSYLAIVEPNLSPYSNSVFSAIFSTTSICNTDFLECGRALNSVFWLVFVGLISYIILMTRSVPVVIFGFWVSTSIISFFSVSFLPEIMYYSLVSTALVLLVVGLTLERRQLMALTVSGVVFGLAMLTKPHAVFIIFFAVLAIAFMLIVTKDVGWKTISLSLLSPAVAVMTRVIIELIFSSRNPLDFFGRYLGYGDSLPSFTDPFPIKKPGEGQAQIVTVESALIESFVPYFVVALIFYLPPLIIGIALAIRRSKELEREHVALIIFSAAATGMLLVSFLFGGLVSPGDDHSDRLLLRYSEFLLPLTWLFLIATMAKEKAARSRTGLLGLIPFLTGALGVIFGGLESVTLSTTDSLILFSLSGSAIWFFLFLIGGTGTLLQASVSNRVVLTSSVSVLSIALLITSYSEIVRQSDFFVGEADNWAPIFDATQNLEANEIVFVGSKRATVASLLLSSGKLNSKYGLVNGYSELPRDWIEEYKYAVISSEIYPPRDSREIANSTDKSVTLYELRSESGIYNDLFLESSKVEKFTSIGIVTDWGYWVDGPESTISLKSAIPNGESISLQLIRHQLTRQEDLQIVLDSGEAIPINLPVAGRLYEAELTAGADGISSITISYKDSVKIGYVEGMEDYSFGVGKIG